MKKIIAIISALVIAASMTACTGDKGTNEAAETTNVETTNVEATVAETTAETTTAAETEAAEEAAPKAEESEAESIDEVFANRADGLWAVDLSNKVNEWPGNVRVSVTYEMGGVESFIYIETLAEKYIYTVEVADMLSSTQIFDGEKYYIIDDINKTYCINPENYEDGGVDNYMLADDGAECFVDAGTEEINGTKYIYEEYDIMGVPTRYYFNETGDIAYYSIDMGGEKTVMEFSVVFDDAYEAAFAPPTDFTEITHEEYISQFME